MIDDLRFTIDRLSTRHFSLSPLMLYDRRPPPRIADDSSPYLFMPSASRALCPTIETLKRPRNHQPHRQRQAQPCSGFS
jgi:hypothetical protein